MADRRPSTGDTEAAEDTKTSTTEAVAGRPFSGSTTAVPRDRERGSVLLLMPVAVLIVVILGAIAVDRAVVFGAQRELVQSAQAAANDAAAVGADLDHLRRGELQVRLDRQRVERAVQASLVGVDDLVSTDWHLRGDEIVVVLEQRVELVFSKGVPGAADTTIVRATATARLAS